MADEHLWQKSSYSDSQGGSCVEMADLTYKVGIRDSKDKQGPALLVPASAWSAFVRLVRSERRDFDAADD
ncbi:DUF397 domain-containing protein [Streptomyces sp. NPDC058256]|uniref:DUF397 domain-containing protein n=1 Tax=Streptomyces sp. NPDC058256 TaxID=3346408 RepID=UPI0036E021E2